MGNNWYTIGDEGIQKEEAAKEQRALDRIFPRRVWMPANSEKQYVFLDDEGFGIHEHQFRKNGNWRNWVTCLQGVEDDCPCCDVLGVTSRSFVVYYSVVSCTAWTNERTGVTYQYELQLLPAKLELAKKLKSKKDKKGSLVGHMYNVSRTSDRGSSAGTEWEFERQVDLDKMFNVINFYGKTLPEWWAEAGEKPGGIDELRRFFQIALESDGKTPVESAVPFNYFELLKPQSPDKVRAAVEGAESTSRGGGRDNAGGGGGYQDDVPF